MIHTMHMLTPVTAVIFAVATVLAVALHCYNQWRPHKLEKCDKPTLIEMFRMMERNMGLDCGIMIFMSAHAFGWLTHELIIVAGWSIVAVRIYITYRAYTRAKMVYGL